MEKSPITIAAVVQEAFPRVTVQRRKMLLVPTSAGIPNSYLETTIIQDLTHVPTPAEEFDHVDKPQISQDGHHFITTAAKDDTKALVRDDQILIRGKFSSFETYYPSPDLQNFFVIAQDANLPKKSLYFVGPEGAKEVVADADEIRRGDIIKNQQTPSLKVFVTTDAAKQNVHVIDSNGHVDIPVKNAQNLRFFDLQDKYGFRAIASIEGDSTFITLIDERGITRKRYEHKETTGLPNKVEIKPEQVPGHYQNLETIYIRDDKEIRYSNDQYAGTTYQKPKAKEIPQIEAVSEKAIKWRQRFKKLASWVFPKEVVAGSKNLEQFEKMMEQEGTGGVIVLKHFSLSEVPRTAKDLVLQSKVLINKRVYGFLARHQNNSAVRFFGYLLDMPAVGIETENSRLSKAKKGKPVPPRNDGLVEANKIILSSLKHSGLLIFTPEGERLDSLEPFKKRATGTLFANAKHHNVTNFVVLPTVYKLKNQKDYWSRNAGPRIFGKYYLRKLFTSFNLHLFRPMEVRYGKPQTYAQIMEAANNDFGQVDEVMFQMLQQTADMEKGN